MDGTLQLEQGNNKKKTTMQKNLCQHEGMTLSLDGMFFHCLCQLVFFGSPMARVMSKMAMELPTIHKVFTTCHTIEHAMSPCAQMFMQGLPAVVSFVPRWHIAIWERAVKPAIRCMTVFR